MEKWNTLDMNHPRWLGTVEYLVRMVDPLSGDVKLLDEDIKQTCLTHTTKGPRGGWRFKFTAPGVNLDDRRKNPERYLPESLVEKKRVEQEKATTVKLRKDGQPRAKKRPKHIIEAELKALHEKRSARKAMLNEKRASLGLRPKA